MENQTTSNLKSTLLCQEHINLGARMVEFAGWNMPVQYAGLKEEHLGVRQNVGLFDVSHMGEIRFKGPNALATLEHLTTNEVSKLKKNQAQYSLLPNEKGGLVDDIIIYCIEPNQEYFVCVNAANTDKDFEHMKKNNRGAEITNESSEWSQIAVQGPKAMTLLTRIFGAEINQLPTFNFQISKYQSARVMIARTGYTGEDGCELFIENSGAVSLWRELLAKGQDLGVQPIGLGARDTLRTEMKYSLYGHEIDDLSNPYSAGLGWVVKPQAKDFIGRDIMVKQKEMGLSHKLVGFELLDRGIARHAYPIVNASGEKCGIVTSGTPSPSLNNISIGIAYVPKAQAEVGSEIFVEIRGKPAKAKVVATPFVKDTSLAKLKK